MSYMMRGFFYKRGQVSHSFLSKILNKKGSKNHFYGGSTIPGIKQSFQGKLDNRKKGNETYLDFSSDGKFRGRFG